MAVRTYGVFYGQKAESTYVEAEGSAPSVAASRVARDKRLPVGTAMRVSAVVVGRGTGRVTEWEVFDVHGTVVPTKRDGKAAGK